MNIRTRLALLEKRMPRPSCPDPWHVIATIEVATEAEADRLPTPRQTCPTCREPLRGVRQIVVIRGEDHAAAENIVTNYAPETQVYAGLDLGRE